MAAVTAHGDALTDLNAKRAANGIPAGIVENPEWSAGCAQHMRYLELNRFAGDWHTELPGRPGYSEAGRLAAGSSVLSNAPSVGLETDWESSPYHFAQLLAPKLSVTGYADGCMYTWPGYQRPEPATLRTYTYPGDGAQDTTSPYLYVFGFGGGTTGARLSDASLAGPDGAVPVRVVDNHSPGAAGLLPPGGILFPDGPLAEDGVYTAQVTLTSDAGARSVTRWSFRAGTVTEGSETAGQGAEADPSELAPLPALPAPRTPKVTFTLRQRSGGSARATISARGETIGRRARITVRRLRCSSCRSSTRTIRLTKTARRLELGRRPVRVTVKIQGFWAGETPFRDLTLVRSLS